MRSRRNQTTMAASALVLGLAGPAYAGPFRPDPAPGWLAPAFIVMLTVFGLFFACVVAAGIAYRRRK
jgi:hypothetical protein